MRYLYARNQPAAVEHGTATSGKGGGLHVRHTPRSQWASDAPEAIRPGSLEEAYAAQEAFQRLWTGQASPDLAGYKVAATSQAIRDQVGLEEPLLGGIFQGMVHHSPHEVSLADCQQLGFECEIAIRLGGDLTPAGAPFDRESVAHAVDAVYPAFELVDMRNCVLDALDLMSTITDNAMTYGVVLGSEVRDWRDRDIGNLAGRVSVNGKPSGEGNTRDALGHPVEGLAWIANNLASREHALKPGMVVITGSIIATRFPSAGDHVVYEVDGLGSVEMSVT